MSRYMVQSVIVYGVNVFAMPGMQCVVYAIEYQVTESLCYNSHCSLYSGKVWLGRSLVNLANFP